MIKVSFILIGYNIEQYVEKAILSVVNVVVALSVFSRCSPSAEWSQNSDGETYPICPGLP